MTLLRYRRYRQAAALALLLAGAQTLALSASAEPYEKILLKPILPEVERRSMMPSFVDRNLPAIELSSTLEAWESRRKDLRTEILRIVGLSDLDPSGASSLGRQGNHRSQRLQHREDSF